MKRGWSGFLIAVMLLGAGSVSAQQASVHSYPEITYDSTPDFLKLPDHLYLGEAVGVATNSKSHIFVYHRVGPDASRLFQFDQTGKFIREIGQGVYGFVFAEKVRVDPEDNIWVLDQGSNMVIKFSPEGRILMTFGRRPEPGQVVQPVNDGAGAQTDSFVEPADVAWDAAGNIYVADGHGNSRIAKFDKNGRFIKSWGTRGKEPGQFTLPHGIAIDAQNNVYVADRGNRRIQVFDADGTFKTQFTDIPVTAICLTRGTHQYLYSANLTGEIYKMELDGRIVGRLGKPGKLLKEFGGHHQIDCGQRENELIVGEVNNWRVQKITLHQ